MIENKEQSGTIEKLEEHNRQLMIEIKELSDTIKSIKEKGQEKSKMKEKHNKDETGKSEVESNQTKTKEEQPETTTIIVGGYDEYNQLGEKPNNKNIDSLPVISPPVNLLLASSSLLSYSVCNEHSVLVTKDGLLLGIGDNSDGRISRFIKKTKISQFTEFSIKDDRGRQLTPISAVCCGNATLYMFSKIGGDGRQLAYCNKDINGGYPVFLSIGDEEPVSLFGGYFNAAAIMIKVKSSSSNIRFIHSMQLFLFQVARKHRASRA